jgi:hypothetical protein
VCSSDLVLDGQPVMPAMHDGQPAFEVVRVIMEVQAAHNAATCPVSASRAAAAAGAAA